MGAIFFIKKMSHWLFVKRIVYCCQQILCCNPITMTNRNTNDRINAIPIRNVLDLLWITYRGDAIIEEWKQTHGLKINVRGNYINDFSKDRAKGWPFAVVKKLKRLSSAETYQWFCENFGICGDGRKKKKRKSRNKKRGFCGTPSYHLDY